MQYPFSKEDIQLLNTLPLTEVMRHNGHYIQHKNSREAYYICPNPAHEDHDPSFRVELSPSDKPGGSELPLCRFYCKACGAIHGAGAIQLQAALMGCGTTGEDFCKVVTRLARDFHLNIKGIALGTDFTFVDPVQEFSYVDTAWTDEHLRALGCHVQQQYRDGHEEGDEEATGQMMYSWSMVGRIGEEEQQPVPFDPSEMGRIFGLYPIGEFTTPGKEFQGGVYRSYRQVTNEQYPIFIFRSMDMEGHWRIKKYEPYSRPDSKGRQYKWTWWYEGGKNLDRNFHSAIYGDCDVMDALYNSDVIPQDSSTHHNHPVVTKHYKDRDGVMREKKLFKRVVICSGPRDALQVYYHSDAHVVYPHSETAHISQRSIHRLLAIAEQVYILFDMDETGRREARQLNLEYLQMATVTLPEDLATLTGRRNGKPCKDVSDFFEQYWQIARHKPALKNKTLNEIFYDILQDAQPLKFWKIHAKKNAVEYDDGTVQDHVYEMLVDNMLRFLKASGMGIYKGKNDEEAARFVCIRDNRVRFLKDDEVVKTCKDLMKDWLSSHSRYNDTELRSLISRSTQILSKNILEELPIIHIDPMFWGPTWDYLFFANGALYVTAESADLIPYGELGFLVNEESILPRAYTATQPLFRIVENPMYEQYERQHLEREEEIAPGDHRSLREEAIRWNRDRVLWPFRLEIFKPMNEMPAAFQFLYDTGRMYWMKERASKREGKARERWLTPEQQQFQDMQFVNKAAGIGYVLSRFRQVNIGRMAYLVDYSVDDERKSQGGTGKSIIPSMLQAVRYECHINGKGWKTSSDMSARNFVSYDYLKHGYINIEDLRKSVDSEELYNVANSDFNRKRLNKDEETIRAEVAAKVFITSNGMFDQAEASTRRRLWPMLVSNYYHEGNGLELSNYNPYTKFGFGIGKSDMPREEWDAMVTMLVQFLQFYLAHREYVEAPMGSAGRHRLLSARKEFKGNLQFIDWADKLFKGDMFYGIPLPKIDLVVSYFQYVGQDVSHDTVVAYAKSAKFGEMLKAYCDTMGITYNPDIVYKRRSDIGRLPRTRAYTYDWNAAGRLTGVRSADERASCYYFFRRGEEPTNPDDVLFEQHSDPACEGYILEE